jgi:hypothetical protein
MGRALRCLLNWVAPYSPRLPLSQRAIDLAPVPGNESILHIFVNESDPLSKVYTAEIAVGSVDVSFNSVLEAVFEFFKMRMRSRS